MQYATVEVIASLESIIIMEVPQKLLISANFSIYVKDTHHPMT